MVILSMSIKEHKFPFYYDESSPSCLRWSEDRFSGKSNGKLEINKGDPAGDLTDKGYYRVIVNGKRLFAHRVIYEMFNGKIPTNKFIDHIDGVRSNNTINNLRLVSCEGNSRNHKKRKTNKTGITGVTLLTTHKGKYEHYMAHCYDLKGNRITKSFSVIKYGKEAAFQLACEWRDRFMEDLNSLGAGYTERHLGS